MAYMKAIIAKVGGCGRVQDYLEKEDRAEAIAVSPAIGDASRWGQIMDKHRRAAGKDRGRKWYHFVISPDPADYPTTDDVMALAFDWAQENYPGREWAITVHADNANEVRHAHVILNAYDPMTKGKIQRSDAKVAEEWDSAQVLSQVHGMAPLDVPNKARKDTRQKVRLTKQEREMLSKGIVPYKEAIRRTADELAPGCANLAQFRERMAARGFEVKRNRNGGLTYRDPKSRAATDRSLGADYTASGLENRFAWVSPLSGFSRDAAGLPAAPLSAPSAPSVVAQLERRARRRGVRDAKALAELLALVSDADDPSARVDGFLADAQEAQRLAEGDLERGEASLYRLACAVEKIDAYRRTRLAFDGYKAAGLARRAFAKSHEAELSQFAEARAWLEGHELADEGKHDAVIKAFNAADAGLAALADNLDLAKSQVAHARKLAALYKRVSRPPGADGIESLRKSKTAKPKKGARAMLEKRELTTSALERAARRAEKASERARAAVFALEAERRGDASLDDAAQAALGAARAIARGQQQERDSGAQARGTDTTMKR